MALNLTALNDIVLEKLAHSRQVSPGVYLAGRLLASSASASTVEDPKGRDYDGHIAPSRA